MNSATVVKIADFLHKWQVMRGPSTAERTEIFRSDFIRLVTEFVQLKQRTGQDAKEKAPGYNIFRLLRLERYELMHSAFLANLLDPKEDHGQGMLFLTTFLLYCKYKYDDFPVVVSEIDKGRWSVVPETVITSGRVDITISNLYSGHLYFIENKVDASEQVKQLERYGHQMEKMKECPNQALIFLTLTGYDAASSGGYKIFRLSYHQDIPAWLDMALREDEKIPNGVLEVVRQYRDLVIRL